jgi:putative membrane protein
MKMSVDQMPTINAALNGLASVFLLLGYIFIKKGNRTAHKRCMIAAFSTSAIFLAGYLWYHYTSHAHTVLQHPTAWVNYLYYFILITHIILAVVIVPMVFITLNHALRERLDKHRRIARWTWPIWMYVSVTGVVVYMFLYVLFAEHTEKKLKIGGSKKPPTEETPKGR